jgi:hypothetical protein
MKEKKEDKTKAITISKKEPQVIRFTEPEFNQATQLYEIKKINDQGDVLDLLTDIDKETVIQKKEEVIKQAILAEIHKGEKKWINYNKLEGKGNANKKSQVLLKETILTHIIRLKLEGYNHYDVIGEICKEYDIKNVSAFIYIEEAMEQLRTRSADKIDDLLQSHLRRYEEIYKWFKANGYVKYAGKTLAAKEKLMGVGQDMVLGVTVSNYFSENGPGKLGYDIKLLTTDKKKRLIALLYKIKPKEKAKDNG